MFKIAKNWFEILKDEFEKDYYKNLEKFLENEYRTQTIYPASENVFNALNAVPFDKIKVVIIGQDPYHEPRQAQGLCFSVPKEIKIPPSLVNIYKEIESEFGEKCAPHGQLFKWAKQGVLLLNSVLTVRRGQAFSHSKKGWEIFTKAIVDKLASREKPIVFLLWGAAAQKMGKDIDSKKHCVLKAAHPSPLSAYAGFFGCGHFLKANEFLISKGMTPIDWIIK